ncbi:MAG: immune inhibitor A [Anaerolineaceae bacterium]|nr:immune inhibitor A [Anaerolineaceae bacterium]
MNNRRIPEKKLRKSGLSGVFSIVLLLPVFFAFFLRSASAAGDPLPNNSSNIARIFGETPENLPETAKPAPVWETGMERVFHVLDIAAGTISDRTGRIFLITDNIVFWCDENALQYLNDEINEKLTRFDRETLPMLRETFGHEDSPGSDTDPRFHVLFTEKIGLTYNGYFSAEDTADPRIRPNSNGMNLLFLNTRLLTAEGSEIFATLSHEFQHMIHNSYDTNEASFVNEGLSGLAEYLAVGPQQNFFVRNYLNDTGRSLVRWPESGNSAPYYGSSFLFTMYLLDRFGTDFINRLVSSPENGLDGIDAALASREPGLTADDIFLQWSAAMLGQLLQEPVRDLDYRDYKFPQNGIYRDIRPLGCGTAEEHETAQYGIRYYSSSCPEGFEIRIEGSAESPVTDLNIPEGTYAWWSGGVNNSIALLSHVFDLREAEGPIRFEYDINYDIEQGYDYYYLLLTDETGQISRLAPSSGTDDNPTGQNLGMGTTGSSYAAVHESISLDPWAGGQVRITFAYVTDSAGLRDGLLPDNFRIPAIGYSGNAEEGDNGWVGTGFTRIRNSMPQRFALTVLHPNDDGTSSAEFFTFEGGEPFSAECPEGSCVFAVSPVSRDIRSRTSFTVLTAPLN